MKSMFLSMKIILRGQISGEIRRGEVNLKSVHLLPPRASMTQSLKASFFQIMKSVVSMVTKHP